VPSAQERSHEFQEILFHELHHRFYNSLQLLSATLGILAREHRHPEEVRRVQERIAMLGGLHRTLSQPLADTSRLSDTLRDLCTGLADGFGRGEVILDVEGPAFLDDLMTIRGLTLILVELVTNALKHGDCDTGQIRVRVSGSRDFCRLTVLNPSGRRSEDGAGTPYVATRFAAAMGGTLIVTTGAEHGVLVTVPRNDTKLTPEGDDHERAFQ